MAPPLSRRHALSAAAAAALGVLPGARPASAAYGDFAKMGTDAGTQGVLAAGDPNNECLFATPGTGLCQVYKSSEPALWDSPNLQGAKVKLLKAAATLADVETDIAKSRWTAVLQALGASRDLREAVGFLTKEQPAAAAAAKKVFLDLDGVKLAADKKDQKAAKAYFAKFSADLPKLIAQLEEGR